MSAFLKRYGVASRARSNETIRRTSAGVTAEVGDLVLVSEAPSTRHRDRSGRKLQHEFYTGPLRVKEVPLTGISVGVTMQGRKNRARSVS
ncbi:unnamed protein product, partial [Pylaiella littoralis]